jgi:hypothetical protein
VHRVAAWLFVLFYLYVGNLFRNRDDRTHPSFHNRADLLVFHLDPIGVALFGDWRSSALTILLQRYEYLVSPQFARLHRMLGERVQIPQPVAHVSPDRIISELFDKPNPILALTRLLRSGLIEEPLESWREPLETVAASVKYGYDAVITDMAGFLRTMNLRFENDE